MFEQWDDGSEVAIFHHKVRCLPHTLVTRAYGDGSTSGIYDGPIAVAMGATLRVDYSDTIVANEDVTIDGALDHYGGYTEYFVFNGTAFANNGTVSVDRFTFSRAGPQTVAGTGTWTSNLRFFVAAGSTVVPAQAMTLSPSQSARDSVAR